MFKNVVSTQELLSDSQRSNYSSDSALFGLSQTQRQHSQNEFSQVRTQDLFTQNQTSGSQPENSFPQTKKMSMYDRWTSKGAVFKKDQTMRGKASGSSYHSMQQQGQLNQNKNKDTEDKEMLQQVVNIVQDCNKEVKSTLTAVKEKLESQNEQSGEKLGDILKAFLEDIWKHEERMFQAVQERDDSKTKLQELEQKLTSQADNSKEKIHGLEKQLAVREAELKQLQGQLEQKGKSGDLKQMAKAVRQEMMSPQLAVENKLMEIMEMTKEASEQQTEQMNQYKHQMTAQSKQYGEWKTFNQRLIKDMEKRLQKDMAAVRKDLQRQEDQWLSCLQNQLASSSAAYSQEVEKLLERALGEGGSQQGASGGDSREVVAAVKKEVQGALARQSRSVEQSLQAALTRQTQKQQQQLGALHKKLLADVTSGIESAALCLPDKVNSQEGADLPLTQPVFEEKFDQFRGDLQRQLQDLHRKHLEDVQRIQRIRKDSQLHTTTTNATGVAAATACKPSFTTTTTTTTIPHAQTAAAAQSFRSSESDAVESGAYKLKLRNEPSLISPMTKLERSKLFCKNRPSPVAAVLPQRHPSTNTSCLDDAENIMNDLEPDGSFSIESYQPGEGQSKCRQTRKRKNKSTFCSKKKNTQKKIRPPKKEIVKDEQVITKTTARTVNELKSTKDREQMMVFDFSQEKSPERSWYTFNSLQLQRSRQPKSQFHSPGVSTESCQSSPAVSVHVSSELMVVRRSRWQTCSTPTRSSCEDMLSTPCMTSGITQMSYQQHDQD